MRDKSPIFFSILLLCIVFIIAYIVIYLGTNRAIFKSGNVITKQNNTIIMHHDSLFKSMSAKQDTILIHEHEIIDALKKCKK